MRIAEMRRRLLLCQCRTVASPRETQNGAATRLPIDQPRANPSSWNFPSCPPQSVFSSLVTRTLEGMGARDQNMFKKIFLAFGAERHTRQHLTATIQGGPMPYPAGHRQVVKRKI